MLPLEQCATDGEGEIIKTFTVHETVQGVSKEVPSCYR